MTCDDYLSMLETLPVEELNYGEAREHVATCRDCNRVTRVVAERERNMIVAYGDLYPSASAGTVAEQAMLTSRRRKVALFYRLSLVGAAVAAVLFIGVSRLMPRQQPGRLMVRQNFMLNRCTAEQVVAMTQGSVSPTASITIAPGTNVLRVSGRPSDLRVIRSIVDQYDARENAGCMMPAAAPRIQRR